MTEFGAKALFDMGGKDKHGDSIKLPGVRTGDLSLRSFKPEIRVSSVRFSPTGLHFFNFLIDKTCYFNVNFFLGGGG